MEKQLITMAKPVTFKFQVSYKNFFDLECFADQIEFRDSKAEIIVICTKESDGYYRIEIYNHLSGHGFMRFTSGVTEQIADKDLEKYVSDMIIHMVDEELFNWDDDIAELLKGQEDFYRLNPQYK